MYKKERWRRRYFFPCKNGTIKNGMFVSKENKQHTKRMSFQMIEYEQKKTRFAWAKYYELLRETHDRETTQYSTYTRYITEDLPTHIKNEFKEMADILKKKWECPVCLDMIEPKDLDITNCGHFYCKGCLESLKSSTQGNKYQCAVCRKEHKK